MRYIRFYGNCGYAGTDFEEYCEFDDDVPFSSINAQAEDLRYSYWADYEYLADDNLEEEIEAIEAHYEDCWCDWEEVTKEEFEENS